MEETELASLAAALRHFAKRRDWDQFHSPRNLAAALIVEAGELLEVFQWMKESDRRYPVEVVKGNSDKYTRYET